MSFQLRKYLDDAVTCIEIPSKLTSENSQALIDLLQELVEKGNVRIIVDLDRTKRIDSSGIGAIVSQIATLRSRQGDIRLANVHDFVREVMSVTHLDKVIRIYSNLEEAVQSYRKSV